MAALAKFKGSTKDIRLILRHNSRTGNIKSNPDIDTSKKADNLRLSPDRGKHTDYWYYAKRLKELYCMKRDDVVTLAGWCISAPKELSAAEQEPFFKACYEFLENRYGAKNMISAYVHYDEVVMVPTYDSWDDITGYTPTITPHLHVAFIPVAPDHKHVQGEKVCANDVLNKKELTSFHPDLQQYLKSKGIAGADGIITGITKKQGRNYSIKEMKNREHIREYKFDHTYRTGVFTWK